MYAEQDYEEALRLIREYRKHLRKKSFLYKNDHEQVEHEYEIKMFEGKILLHMGDYEEAEQIYSDMRQQLRGASATNNDHLRAELSYHLADIAAMKGDRQNQLALLQQSKQEFEQAKYYKEAIDIMFDIGATSEMAKDQLVDHYKEIINLSKSLKNKDLVKLNSARARLEIGYLLRQGDIKVASQFLILAHKDFERLDQTELKLRAILLLADLKAITELSRAVEILENTLKEIEPTNHHYPVVNSKLAGFYLRGGKVDKALHYFDAVDLGASETSLDLANSLLETAKSGVLTSEDNEILQRSLDFATTANNIYDQVDLKIGKAIGYLIEGIASYQLQQESGDNSKLQLIHFLAKKIDTEYNYKVDPWMQHIVQYLADSDLDVYQITSKLPVQDDIPSMMQNAEILHLLGLYKLSSTELETAHSLLDSSRSLYVEATKKTGNFKGLMQNIERQVEKSMPSSH